MSDNPYKTPHAELGESESSVRQRVDEQQSMLLAIIGGLCGFVIAVGLWIWSSLLIGQTSLLLPFIGVIVGSMVRWLGRGMEAKYGILGVLVTALAVVVCVGYGGARGLGLAFVLPTLALGFMLSFRRLGFDEGRDYYRSGKDGAAKKVGAAASESPDSEDAGGPPVTRLSRRRSRRRR